MNEMTLKGAEEIEFIGGVQVFRDPLYGRLWVPKDNFDAVIAERDTAHHYIGTMAEDIQRDSQFFIAADCEKELIVDACFRLHRNMNGIAGDALASGLYT